MKTKNKTVIYKDYADYLSSEKWRQVKEDYNKNENSYICLCCNKSNNLEYHHFKYPKDWNNDSWENLILLCDICHKLAHDLIPINNNITLRQYLRKLIINSIEHNCNNTLNELGRQITESSKVDILLNNDLQPYKIIIKTNDCILHAPRLARFIFDRKLKANMEDENEF